MTVSQRDPRRTPLAKAAGFVDYRGTKTADNPIINPPKEAWFVQASKGGSAISLTPEFFPYARSRDEARDRVMERVRHDPAFTTLFKGYLIHYVLMTDCIQIK
jgi:hypothetical protein